MNSPIFEHIPDFAGSASDAFSAAFLDQQSYIELLRIADTYFSLNMTTRDRKLPCQKNSYMVISRYPPQDKSYLWKGIGRKVSLTVTDVMYNERYGVLAALVQMKNNFTCNKQPHIVLAKREGVNNVLVSRVVDGSIPEGYETKVEKLYSSHRAHGKIGVIVDSAEETLNPDMQIVNGIAIRKTHDIVSRPEVVYTVEQPPPPCLNKFVSFDQFKKMGQQRRDERKRPAGYDDDVMEITLEAKDDGVRATGETYQGEPVMKGPRGGQYIIKDGKKKYVPGSKGGGKSDVVYNVNILDST
jgi:hypothetical protein